VAIDLSTAGPGRMVDMLLLERLLSGAYMSTHFFDPLSRALCARLKTFMICFPDTLALSACEISCEYSAAHVII